MFKKATIHVIEDVAKFDGLEDVIDQAKFLPCGTHELKTFGWYPVRDGELMMRSHGHILLRFMVETKVIPVSAIKVRLAEKVAELTDAQGFAPGNKATSELKEQVIDELTARALTRRAVTGVWIDVARSRMIVDSSVVGTLGLIVRSLTNLTGVQFKWLEHWVGDQLDSWLLDEDSLPTNYVIDDAIAMEYPGERGTTVTFKKADLGTPAVHMHAAAGAHVVQLALTYKSRVSFSLSPLHQLKNIRLLDIVLENQVVQDADVLENSFVLMALELRDLIDSLSEKE